MCTICGERDVREKERLRRACVYHIYVWGVPFAKNSGERERATTGERSGVFLRRGRERVEAERGGEERTQRRGAGVPRNEGQDAGRAVET